MFAFGSKPHLDDRHRTMPMKLDLDQDKKNWARYHVSSSSSSRGHPDVCSQCSGTLTSAASSGDQAY